MSNASLGYPNPPVIITALRLTDASARFTMMPPHACPARLTEARTAVQNPASLAGETGECHPAVLAARVEAVDP